MEDGGVKALVKRLQAASHGSNWHLRAIERAREGIYDKLSEMIAYENPAGVHLDCGCGDGYLLAATRQSVVGADIADEYLQNATGARRPLVKCDIRRLPFRQGVFESASYAFVMHAVYDKIDEHSMDVETGKISTLKEVRDALGPSGSVFIVTDSDDKNRYGDYLSKTGFKPKDMCKIKRGWGNFSKVYVGQK